MNLDEFIKKVKDKKGLRSLSDKFVLKIVKEYIEVNKLQQLDKKSLRQLVKKVRAKLHEIHGAFLSVKFSKVKKLLGKLDNINDIATHKALLRLHKSTKERLQYYSQIYDKIFGVTNKPKSLLDLGCGLNPFSLPFMKFMPDMYYAVDLKKSDIELINEYFRKVKIKGKARVMDLTKEDIVLPQVNVCFMFKLLDSLESVKFNVTKTLFKKIKAGWIVVSFATTSLGGKKRIKERGWFEKYITNLEYEKFSVPNEVFYIIKKH